MSMLVSMLMRFRMRRKKLTVIVALLTFIIGVVLSYGWSSHKTLDDFLVKTLSPELQGDKFVAEMDACGPQFNSHQYLILATGQSLTQTGESFDSEGAALNELERRLSHATKILERTVVLDEQKRKVGERVLALFPSEASVFESHGAVVSAINAPTIEVALEFEKEKAKKNR